MPAFLALQSGFSATLAASASAGRRLGWAAGVQARRGIGVGFGLDSDYGAGCLICVLLSLAAGYSIWDPGIGAALDARRVARSGHAGAPDQCQRKPMFKDLMTSRRFAPLFSLRSPTCP